MKKGEKYQLLEPFTAVFLFLKAALAQCVLTRNQRRFQACKNLLRTLLCLLLTIAAEVQVVRHANISYELCYAYFL